MKWIAILLLLGLHLPSTTNISIDAENSSTANQSEILNEEFIEASVRAQKSLGEGQGWDTCSIPCDITAKLLRDEKNSFCGHLQQALLAYGRSTRKLVRDVMDEQQRALDFLTSQVTELMAKMQTLSTEVQRSNAEMYTIKPAQSHGRDCSDIKDNLVSVVPKIPSGIYIVNPEQMDSSFEVFCEMDYMGGGWTVMQRRTDGLTNFKRPWADYADGFGHLPGRAMTPNYAEPLPSAWSTAQNEKGLAEDWSSTLDRKHMTSTLGEHWLGLRKVFHILNQRDTRFQLHIALVSHDDTTAYASYDDFRLDNETHFYSIHLGRYAGSAGFDGCLFSPSCQATASYDVTPNRRILAQTGDAFRGYDQEQNQDTAPFSASDVDNDGCVPSCSMANRTVESCSLRHNNTGWWFNQCGLANLNGSPQEPHPDGGKSTHILWDTWTQSGVPHSIKGVTMKIRRIPTNN